MQDKSVGYERYRRINFSAYFRPLLKAIQGELEDEMRDVKNKLMSFLLGSTGSSGTTLSGKVDLLFEYFSFSDMRYVLGNMIRYVCHVLFSSTVDMSFTFSDGVMSGSGDRNYQYEYDGLFSGALIRAPLGGFGARIPSGLDVNSMGWPRIFYIVRGEARYTNDLMAVGVVRLGSPDFRRLEFNGYCLHDSVKCRSPMPTGDRCSDCSDCLGLSAFNFSLEGEGFEKEVRLDSRDGSVELDIVGNSGVIDNRLGEAVMDQIYKGAGGKMRN